MPRLPYGITQYYLPPDSGKPVPALYMGGRRDLRKNNYRSLPYGQASTNLYCLVNRGTCV